MAYGGAWGLRAEVQTTCLNEAKSSSMRKCIEEKPRECEKSKSVQKAMTSRSLFSRASDSFTTSRTEVEANRLHLEKNGLNLSPGNVSPWLEQFVPTGWWRVFHATSSSQSAIYILYRKSKNIRSPSGLGPGLGPGPRLLHCSPRLPFTTPSTSFGGAYGS